MSGDEVVGFAGDDPDGALQQLVTLRRRGSACTQLIESLERYFGQSQHRSSRFLLVRRTPTPSLWEISNGSVTERTPYRQAYVGDTDGYNRYRSRTLQWDDRATTDEFRLVSSVQSVIEMDDLPTVGGYVTRVTGSRNAPFRFRGDPTVVVPWFTHATVNQRPGGVDIKLATPSGGDPTVYSRIDIAGCGDTFSALVHAISRAGVALMHSHEEPWRPPIRLPVPPDELRRAAARFGQQLALDDLTERILNGELAL